MKLWTISKGLVATFGEPGPSCTIAAAPARASPPSSVASEARGLDPLHRREPPRLVADHRRPAKPETPKQLRFIEQNVDGAVADRARARHGPQGIPYAVRPRGRLPRARRYAPVQDDRRRTPCADHRRHRAGRRGRRRAAGRPVPSALPTAASAAGRSRPARRREGDGARTAPASSSSSAAWSRSDKGAGDDRRHAAGRGDDDGLRRRADPLPRGPVTSTRHASPTAGHVLL